MNDQRREILIQVAAGKITAEEGAARLESLEVAEAPAPIETVATAGSTQAAPGQARRVKVVSQIGSAEIVGDPSVAFVIAEGPHRARQEGDMMVIDHEPFDENDHFIFGRGGRRVINGTDVHRRKLTIRMNPALALFVSVQAGSVRIEGVQGSIDGEVQAGNCHIAGFRGPLGFAIMAGNLSASGRLTSGASKVRCEMGSVKVNLEKGSSVRVTARTTLGKVSIEGAGSDQVSLGDTGRDVTIGSGAASLDLECTMGNVRVTAE